MRKLKVLLPFFVILMTFAAFAESSAAVLPLAAKEDDRLAAKDIDSAIDDVLDKIKGAEAAAFADSLGTKDKKQLAACEDDLKCQLGIAKKKKADFYIFSKMKLSKKSGKTLIDTYLFDGKGNKLENEKATFESGADPDEIAKGLVKKWNKMLAAHASDEGEEEEEEPAKPAAKGPNVDAAVKEALEAYAEGDLKKADEALKDAANKDVTAKELKGNIANIAKFTSQANGAIKAKHYDEAIQYIAKAESLNEKVLELGANSKYRVYKKDVVERIIYDDPSGKDIKSIDVIHAKFDKQRAKLRKDKEKSIAESEAWLNARILEREAKLKKFAEDSEAAKNQKKQGSEDLKKKINDMKYQWQKDDNDIDQKIVELENKLTLYEQKEKGVVKTANVNKYEKEKEKELADTDKKYGDMLKKMREEKEALYKKQNDELEAGNKKTEAAVLALETKKKANDEKIAELDKKMTAEQEQFDENEKKIMSANEETKMKNEDEDRKYKVEVEKEYQAKFDDLNKKLQEFDAQESDKRKDLEKYNAATEEYMFKNAEVMSKYQEEIEKERTALDAECKTKKEAATADAEKAYAEELEKLNKDKAAVEEKIAAGETPALKKELAAVEKKISKHEGSKDAFMAGKIAKVDEECENKSMALDMKLAQKSDELNKDNAKFQAQKKAEEKKATGDFKAFQQRQAAFKKNIDSQVAAAQKERDRKLEAREKERSRLSETWQKESEKRQKDLENKQRADKNAKERLVKENEGIDANIAITNAKWADKSDDMRVKFQESNQKYEKAWTEKYEKTDEEYKEKKEEIENKYAAKEVADKDAQKNQKEKWEEELNNLHNEKDKRQEERRAILAEEKEKWEEQVKTWDEEEQQRKEDMAQFQKEMKPLNAEDKKEAIAKKKEAEQNYDEAVKDIDEKELEQIRLKFKEEYKVTKAREVVEVKESENIASMKAEAFAKSGLNKLNDKDLLGARRAFAEALKSDKENKIAQHGMSSINDTAKSMYWEAYGKRESNKQEAIKIFKLLVQTLMPSNEFFLKAKNALEELQ